MGQVAHGIPTPSGYARPLPACVWHTRVSCTKDFTPRVARLHLLLGGMSYNLPVHQFRLALHVVEIFYCGAGLGTHSIALLLLVSCLIIRAHGVLHTCAPHDAHRPPIDAARLNTLAQQASEVLGPDIYGGGFCLMTSNGTLYLGEPLLECLHGAVT